MRTEAYHDNVLDCLDIDDVVYVDKVGEERLSRDDCEAGSKSREDKGGQHLYRFKECGLTSGAGLLGCRVSW